MAAEHWFRWHHGTVNDPKWRVVAARASSAMSRNVTVGHVLSVWACMLECASQSNPRGLLTGWDDEDVAAGLGVEADEVRAIREAMQGKTLEDDALSGWKSRQPKAEDLRAADRKRAQRERENAAPPGVTGGDETGSHDSSRNVTTETETETETEKKKEPRKRAPSKTILPDDFGISDRVRAWASEKGHGRLDQHLESFRAKSAAKGYTYADWDAAFMEAIRENWAKLAPEQGNVIPMEQRPGGGRRAL